MDLDSQNKKIKELEPKICVRLFFLPSFYYFCNTNISRLHKSHLQGIRKSNNYTKIKPNNLAGLILSKEHFSRGTNMLL